MRHTTVRAADSRQAYEVRGLASVWPSTITRTVTRLVGRVRDRVVWNACAVSLASPALSPEHTACSEGDVVGVT